MRHLNSINKLNRTASHRKAMLGNLAMSILDKERVITTLAKAKVVRGVVERLITHGKKGGIHAIRVAGATVTDKTILKKLFSDIAPSYKTREGGYTRIIKIGERPGDNALKCIIELTGRNSQELSLQRKKKKRAGGTEDTAGTQKPAPAAVTPQPEDKKEIAGAGVDSSKDVKENSKKEKMKPTPKSKKKSDAEAEPLKDEKKKKL
jgi:large subunit ribosomal protein L17